MVAGAVQRKGSVVARVIAGVDAKALTAFVRDSVSEKVSLLCTDAWRRLYRKLDGEYPHGFVDHSRGQYVVGEDPYKMIEGFWSTFSSPRCRLHVPQNQQGEEHAAYIAEFQFRRHNRMNEDIFGTAISGC